MTADELDKALASQGTSTPSSTQGQALPVPANGIGGQHYRLDFSQYVPNIRPDEAPESAKPAPVPTRRIRSGCVPIAYDVGPAELKARISGKLWKALERMPKAEHTGMLFLGPSGCGKSSAAAYALQRYYAHGPQRRSEWLGGSGTEGPDVAWLDALEATDEERRYRLGTGDPNWLKNAERADWLVIDDVGTGSSATLVQLVLARRYQACKPTIMTSGLDQKALTTHIGAATVRRVLETGGLKGLLVDCHEKGKR